MPSLLERKLYELCDAIGYEGSYFASTIDSVLGLLKQIDPLDKQFIHVQAIVFIERVLKKLAETRTEPAVEFNVTVADIRRLQVGLEHLEWTDLSEFQKSFKETQVDVFALTEEIKSQLKNDKKNLAKFSSYSDELSPDNMQMIRKIGAKHPELMPKLQQLDKLSFYYPMSVLYNFMFNFDQLSFDENNLRRFLAQDDARIAEILKEYNEIQNIKTMIMAIINLSFKLYIEQRYDMRGISTREDIPFAHVVKMEAELLGFIDWRVEASTSDYERVRKLLAKEFPNLPATAELDEAERKRISDAEIRQNSERLYGNGHETIQRGAEYLHAARNKLRSAKGVRPSAAVKAEDTPPTDNDTKHPSKYTRGV